MMLVLSTMLCAGSAHGAARLSPKAASQVHQRLRKRRTGNGAFAAIKPKRSNE